MLNGSCADPLDQLTFDETTFTRLPDVGGARRWATSTGDTLALRHWPSPPSLDGSGGDVVEVDAVVVDRDVIALRTIRIASPLTAARMYVATLALPFRDFSYAFEVQCADGDPLSRARCTLAILERTLQLSSRVRRAPRLHAYALAALAPECW
jgi:hypothetical protein